MDMILMAFPVVGTRLTIQDAFLQLTSLFGGLYGRQRAAGALGGASRWGTIVLREGKYFERVPELSEVSCPNWGPYN